MNLAKTTSLTALSTVIRMISGFIVNKFIAIYVGPAGLALMGQFQNFISIATTVASGAINNGVIKYSAEYYEDQEQQAKMLSTATQLSIICSLIVSLIVLIFSKQFAVYFLKSESYKSIFLIFGITLVFFALNSLFVSILNGQKEIKKYISVNIVSSFVNLLFTTLLVVYLGIYGALLSLATSRTVVFFVTILFVISSKWFNIQNFIRKFDRDSLIKLGRFSLMAVISVFTVPVSQLIIRNFIADKISLDAAGYWQGIWKISDVYLTLITGTLSVYYLPRLSEIKDNKELRKEILYGYSKLLPLVAVIALGIYIFREPLIEVLYSEKFLPMTELFTFQLIGDFLKIASWLIAFLMLAKAMTRWYIGTEIVFSASFVLLSVFLINVFGLIGVTYAFALNYFLYLLTMLWLFRDLIFKRN